MTTAPAGLHRAGTAILAMLTVVLALLLPAPVHAAAEVPGGSTKETAVPLPLAELDGSFTGSNGHVTSSPGNGSIWSNVAWYSWTPPETVQVLVRATSVSPGGWDNTLEVWTAGGSYVTDNDDYYGLDASLTTTLDGGTTYLIGLGGYWELARGSATLTFATRTPGAPRDVAADFSAGSAEVTWNAPADLAGGITAYEVWCTPEGGTESACGRLDGTPPGTSLLVDGLTDGVQYSVRVRAQNLVGFGEPSAAVTGVPQSPASVDVTTDPAAPVSGQPFDVVVDVTSSGSPVDGGTVDVTVGGVVTEDVPVVAGSATVAGLTRPAGLVAVSADFSGTTVIAAASDQESVTVARRTQTVDLPALPQDLVYGVTAELAATASSGLPVTYAATGSCTVSGTTLSSTGVGTCQVTATQAGDSETEPASATQSTTVGQRGQTITLAELPGLVYDQDPLPVSASSDVGLPVALAATGACVLTDGALVTVAAGECTLTATQAGDTVTSAAAPVVRTTTVAKRPQTLTLPVLPPLVFGMRPTPVTATSDLGLPVVLAAGGACALVDGDLTAVGVGACTLTASAVGDDVSLPGTAVLTAQVMGIPSSLSASLQASVGSQAGGSAVSATGSGLQPGSTLLLTLRDVDQPLGALVEAPDGTAMAMGAVPGLLGAAYAPLGSVTVLPDGTAVVLGALPDLAPGSYQLLALGVALDGSRAENAVPFTVGAQGRLTAVGSTSLPVLPPTQGPVQGPFHVPVVVPVAVQAPVQTVALTSAVPTVAPVALARTGSNAGQLAATGVFSLLLGLVLLVGRRRLRRA